jgi:hypothetical protein
LLKAYNGISRKDQLKYEDLTRETLKAIKALGWTLMKDPTASASSKTVSRLAIKKLKVS